MMRKLLIAMALFYLLCLGVTAYKHWQIYQLSLDAQPISGRVVACEQDPPVADSVLATYEFVVAGRRYQGTFETTPMPIGTAIGLFYSPTNPALNSAERPDFRLRRLTQDLGFVSAGFAFWVVVLAGLRWLRRRLRP